MRVGALAFAALGAVGGAALALGGSAALKERPLAIDKARTFALQSKSFFGPTVSWPKFAGVDTGRLQGMRDRAYGFCMQHLPKDTNCPNAQDWSIFQAFNADRAVRTLLAGSSKHESPFVAGIRMEPGNWRKARASCWSLYSDHGSEDARMLGPCMSATYGSDYFGIVFVP